VKHPAAIRAKGEAKDAIPTLWQVYPPEAAPQATKATGLTGEEGFNKAGKSGPL